VILLPVMLLMGVFVLVKASHLHESSMAISIHHAVALLVTLIKHGKRVESRGLGNRRTGGGWGFVIIAYPSVRG
jgi:hypothetical protein